MRKNKNLHLEDSTRDTGENTSQTLFVEKALAKESSQDKTDLYQWIKPIGKGTFGEVFKVIEKMSN